MSDTAIQMDSEVPAAEEETKSSSTGAFGRVVRYTLVRLAMLFVTVVVGIYLTILIANMGGHVDNIRRGEIRSQISIQIYNSQDPAMRLKSSEEKKAMVDDLVAIEEQRLGLDQPFIVRSFAFLKDALTLNLGHAEHLYSDSGSKTVRLILMERLPATLVMWGLANFILFFAALFVALFYIAMRCCYLL